MKKMLLLAASIAVIAHIGTASAEPNVAPAPVDGHKAAPQESGIAPATPNVAPQAKPQDASDLAGGHRADPQETGIIAPVVPKEAPAKAESNATVTVVVPEKKEPARDGTTTFKVDSSSAETPETKSVATAEAGVKLADDGTTGLLWDPTIKAWIPDPRKK